MPTILSSYEQRGVEIAERLLCVKSQLSYWAVQHDRLSPADREHLLSCAGELQRMPITIDSECRPQQQLASMLRSQVHRRGVQVAIYTDSRYVMDGAAKWLPSWKKRDWRTADKKPVKNADLWRILDEEMKRHQISWTWVAGHSGHPENERADQLARSAIPARTRQS